MSSKQAPRSTKLFDRDDVQILTASDECFFLFRREDFVLGSLVPTVDASGHTLEPVWSTLEYSKNSLCSGTGFLLAQDASRDGRNVIDVLDLEKSRVIFSVHGEQHMLALKLLPSHVVFYSTTDGTVVSGGPTGLCMHHPLPVHEQAVAIEPCPQEAAAVLVLTATNIFLVDSLKGVLTAVKIPVSAPH